MKKIISLIIFLISLNSVNANFFEQKIDVPYLGKNWEVLNYLSSVMAWSRTNIVFSQNKKYFAIRYKDENWNLVLSKNWNQIIAKISQKYIDLKFLVANNGDIYHYIYLYDYDTKLLEKYKDILWIYKNNKRLINLDINDINSNSKIYKKLEEKYKYKYDYKNEESPYIKEESFLLNSEYPDFSNETFPNLAKWFFESEISRYYLSKNWKKITDTFYWLYWKKNCNDWEDVFYIWYDNQNDDLKEDFWIYFNWEKYNNLNTKNIDPTKILYLSDDCTELFYTDYVNVYKNQDTILEYENIWFLSYNNWIIYWIWLKNNSYYFFVYGYKIDESLKKSIDIKISSFSDNKMKLLFKKVEKLLEKYKSRDLNFMSYKNQIILEYILKNK